MEDFTQFTVLPKDLKVEALMTNQQNLAKQNNGLKITIIVLVGVLIITALKSMQTIKTTIDEPNRKEN
jgi:hypothetical protein